MEPTEGERAEAAQLRKQLEDLGNRATVGADMLREYILGNYAAERVLHVMNMDLSAEYVRLRELDDKAYVKVDEKFRAQVNQLVDEYEWVMGVVLDKSKGKPIDKDVLAKVKGDQEEHREADLSRLMKTFAASGDRKRMRAVLDAHAGMPLAAQLGFDPDDF